MTAAPNPRAARLAAGLTQTQAAAIIGATRRTWQDWESGARNMPHAKYALFLMLSPAPQAPPATPAPPVG